MQKRSRAENPATPLQEVKNKYRGGANDAPQLGCLQHSHRANVEAGKRTWLFSNLYPHLRRQKV